MATTGSIATMKGIRKVVRQSVDLFHPRKVILFGSYAAGKPTPDSDVDLLVIMETKEKPLHAAATIAAAIDHPFPLDILVFPPTDWGASLQRSGVFATEVANQGIVLYEARDERVG